MGQIQDVIFCSQSADRESRSAHLLGDRVGHLWDGRNGLLVAPKGDLLSS